MVKKCCVPFCANTYEKGSGIKFQSFPKENKLRKHWCIKLRLGVSINVSKSFVCSKHFLPSDYAKSITTGNKYHLNKDFTVLYNLEYIYLGILDVLNINAVPSQNLPRRVVHMINLLTFALQQNERTEHRTGRRCINWKKYTLQMTMMLIFCLRYRNRILYRRKPLYNEFSYCA